VDPCRGSRGGTTLPELAHTRRFNGTSPEPFGLGSLRKLPASRTASSDLVATGASQREAAVIADSSGGDLVGDERGGVPAARVMGGTDHEAAASVGKDDGVTRLGDPVEVEREALLAGAGSGENDQDEGHGNELTTAVGSR
jgi:hypothetical protein